MENHNEPNYDSEEYNEPNYDSDGYNELNYDSEEYNEDYYIDERYHRKLYINEFGYESLITACCDDYDYGEFRCLRRMYRSDEFIYKLIDNPIIDINQYDNMTGDTALRIACNYGRRNVIQKLLSINNIDYNRPGTLNHTPLITICHMKMEDIASQLLDYSDINYNFVDDNGENALFLACYNKMFNTITKILDKPSVDISLAIHFINIHKNTDEHKNMVLFLLNNDKLNGIAIMIKAMNQEIPNNINSVLNMDIIRYIAKLNFILLVQHDIHS